MTVTRTHFTRILTRTQVNEMIDQLRKISLPPRPFESVKARQQSFEIKAPDGDVVFSGLMHSNGTHYLCRLHREVWSEEVKA